MTTTVGVLHPGTMGAAVGHALVDAGHHVVWAAAGRSAATRARAEAVGLVDAGSLADLLDIADVVLSICPPDAARALARSVAGYGGTFVDANAVAPATAAEIAAEVGSGFVDGGIVGPPPTAAGTTRLFLSGAGAETVAGLVAGSRIEPVVVGEGGPYAASAVKMAYAAQTKGAAALLLAADRAAQALGVADALHAEWARSQPDLARRLDAARESAVEKGWRWEGEMHEIARTFADAGVPDGFHRAAAAIWSTPTTQARRADDEDLPDRRNRPRRP